MLVGSPVNFKTSQEFAQRGHKRRGPVEIEGMHIVEYFDKRVTSICNPPLAPGGDNKEVELRKYI